MYIRITYFKSLTTVRSVLDFETMETDKTVILLTSLTGGGQTYFLQRYLANKSPIFYDVECSKVYLE